MDIECFEPSQDFSLAPARSRRYGQQDSLDSKAADKFSQVFGLDDRYAIHQRTLQCVLFVGVGQQRELAARGQGHGKLRTRLPGAIDHDASPVNQEWCQQPARDQPGRCNPDKRNQPIGDDDGQRNRPQRDRFAEYPEQNGRAGDARQDRDQNPDPDKANDGAVQAAARENERARRGDAGIEQRVALEAFGQGVKFEGECRPERGWDDNKVRRDHQHPLGGARPAEHRRDPTVAGGRQPWLRRLSPPIVLVQPVHATTESTPISPLEHIVKL